MIIEFCGAVTSHLHYPGASRTYPRGTCACACTCCCVHFQPLCRMSPTSHLSERRSTQIKMCTAPTHPRYSIQLLYGTPRKTGTRSPKFMVTPPPVTPFAALHDRAWSQSISMRRWLATAPVCSSRAGAVAPHGAVARGLASRTCNGGRATKRWLWVAHLAVGGTTAAP